MGKGIEGTAAEFWNVDDMIRPKGTPDDDASGHVWAGGDLISTGVSPAEREGILFGGKDCQPLAERIAANVDRFVRGGGLEQ